MWNLNQLLHCAWSTLLFGCVGYVDATNENRESQSDSEAPKSVAAFICDPSRNDPGPAPLRRLTPSQYQNTVQVVFGDAIDLTDVFPEVETSSHIGLVQPDVSQLDVELYQKAASVVAEQVTSELQRFAPCTVQENRLDALGCVKNFLASYGRRVYRSPLTDTDVTRLLNVFDVGFTSGGYGPGLRLLIEAMLAAPRFIYRPEFGTPARATEQALPLSSYELASRLSFAFWNSGPDSQLIEQAANGALATDEGLQAEAERLMAHPRAKASFRQFFYTWFRLNDLEYVTKDRALFPAWREDTKSLMRQQSDAFFEAILFGVDGNLNALFTAPIEAFAPSGLSNWYPVPDGAAGLLTLPALLTVHSKPRESFPIYRGVFVREQLLCQPLPAPPPNVAEPPEPAPGLSTRQRFEQHSTDQACQGCHRLIDPLGFAFENYDAIGRYRTHDEGQPINASGELFATDMDGPFNGLVELSAILAASAEVRACVTRQWFRYVMQRFEQEADGCSMRTLLDDFAASDYTFAALRAAIVKTPAFRLRRPIQGEESSQ